MGDIESIHCFPRAAWGTDLQPQHLLLRPQRRKALLRTSALMPNFTSVTFGSVSLLKHTPVSSSVLHVCISYFIRTSEDPGLGSKSHGEEPSKKTT